MKKSSKKYFGFTLVELIIVITILAILATISFVSFQGYTRDSRDSNRLFSIKEISKSLEITKTTVGIYPDVENQSGTGTIGGVILSKVGVLGDNNTKLLKVTKTPIDPVTGNKYLYGVSYDNKYYQIAGTFENLNSNILTTTYADAGNYKAKVEGNYKGILKYSTGGSNYVTNLPSLIFLSGGTLDLINQEGYFVINNGKNLPYLVDPKTTQFNDSSSGVLKQLTGTSSVIKSLFYDSNTNILDLASSLYVSKDLVGQEIYGDKFFSNYSNLLVSKKTITSCNTIGQIIYGTTDGTDSGLTCNDDIILCSGNGTGIILNSCNLGATQPWDGFSTTIQSSPWIGNYYQWGRNKGFVNSDTSSQTTLLTSNPNSNDIYLFVKSTVGSRDWLSVPQNDLWGGSTSDSNYSDAAGTTSIGRQGPCLSGRHIPSQKDWNTIYYSISKNSTLNLGTVVNLLKNNLKLTPSGYRSGYNGIDYYYINYWGFYPISSPVNNGARVAAYTDGGDFQYVNTSLSRSDGMNIRCVKN